MRGRDATGPTAGDGLVVADVMTVSVLMPRAATEDLVAAVCRDVRNALFAEVDRLNRTGDTGERVVQLD